MRRSYTRVPRWRKDMLQKDYTVVPMALGDPTGERLCFRWAGRRAQASLRAETSRGERQRDSLNRSNDATNILPSHSSHTFLKMHLECKLERDSHDWFRAPLAPCVVATHSAARRPNFESGSKVQRTVRTRCILQQLQRCEGGTTRTTKGSVKRCVQRGQNHTAFESRGMMRKPEGRRGASSEKEASIGANTSSAQVPTALSSTPLHT